MSQLLSGQNQMTERLLGTVMYMTVPAPSQCTLSDTATVVLTVTKAYC